MKDNPFSLWVYLSQSPLLWLTVTLLVYALADAVSLATGRHPLANPVLHAMWIIGLFLVVTGTSQLWRGSSQVGAAVSVFGSARGRPEQPGHSWSAPAFHNRSYRENRALWQGKYGSAKRTHAESSLGCKRPSSRGKR